jgi:hypothetical protein
LGGGDADWLRSTSDWYMADVLEHICRRRKIKDHQDYALVSQEKKIVIPMDRTVASLQGETELMLVKQSALGEEFKMAGRATDPNGMTQTMAASSY